MLGSLCGGCVRVKHAGIIVSARNHFSIPLSVTHFSLLETIVTRSGDRLASCSANKGGFRRVHRSRDVMLTTPSRVRIKNELNYNFTAL
jgi:hypothetical protein